MDTTASIDLSQIASSLSIPLTKIERTVSLLDDGNTVPFITRYRKDQTGGLDEEQIRAIQEQIAKLRLLAERKSTILKSIESQGQLTPQLAKRIAEAPFTKELEDLYLPFKPKKQTLATLARQRGLEPLANEIYSGTTLAEDLAARAAEFVRVDRDVHNVESVMQGVGHLLAERFSERADLRDELRRVFWSTGQLVSGGLASESAEVAAENSKQSSQPKAEDSELPSSKTTATTEPQNETASATNADQPAAPIAKPPASQKKKKQRKKEDAAFEDYYNFQESVRKIPPHRVLAINRGERAKVLRVKVNVDDAAIKKKAEALLVPADHPQSEFLRTCLHDALARLVCPALEREVRRELTELAEAHAVQVFVRNLRNLLLQPPVRGHRVLAIDPGYRSGCKLCAVDDFGNLLADGVIHIVGNEGRRKQGREDLAKMIRENNVSLVAIGNGTACRQTEQLVADVIGEELKDVEIAYVIVNEAGASVYSTSPTGREELPDHDAVIRSAISIGRRLLDPLSELVKINPANLGVGLYQHDVKAKHLQESLDAVVESCVNFVGVDVNTASPSLLRYVSGLNQLTARRLYEYRQQHGAFKNREQFKEVPGFGEATFVQAAGFLKINDGANPLDGTWIHPESYQDAQRVLEKVGANVDDVVSKVESTAPAPIETPAANSDDGGQAAADSTSNGGVNGSANLSAATQQSDDFNGPKNRVHEFVAKVSAPQLAEELGIGELLLADILAAISRPGRDPRDDLPPPIFRRGVTKLEDLEPGMELVGTVLNVVDFGAFVDVGLHDSGLIHISRLADRFVSDPHEVVGIGDNIKVWVLQVDKERRRVSLTAIRPGSETPKEQRGRKPAGDQRPRGQRDRKPPAARGKRRPERRKQRRVDQSEPPKKRKPKPVVPITDAMAKGKEPLRSFSDLKQFFDRQEPDEQDGKNNDGSTQNG